MNKLEKIKRRNFVFTIISYVISALLGAFGLSLIITSIIGDYLGAGNAIKEAEAATPDILGVHLSWRFYGLILVVIAVVILLITVFVTSKKSADAQRIEKTRSNRTSLKLENIENNENK